MGYGMGKGIKFLVAIPKGLFRFLAAGDVADEGQSEAAVYGFKIAQAYFHRKLAAVVAASGKFEPQTHRPDFGLFKEMLHMLFVGFAEAFGKEFCMGLTDYVFLWITEHL